jgi:hypothetical protein
MTFFRSSPAAVSSERAANKYSHFEERGRRSKRFAVTRVESPAIGVFTEN